jgi:hypothetical protein
MNNSDFYWFSENTSPPPKKKSKGPYCCAYQCHSCKGNDKIGFFKVVRKKDKLQTDSWIRAIRRENPDKSLWLPGKWTVICGKHFISKKPSNDPNNPDYIPSKFESHTPVTATKDSDRFDRLQNRVEASKVDEQVRCY